MATITHIFDISQTVWWLTTSDGIKEATVSFFDIAKNINGTTISYTIAIVDDNSQTVALEGELYAALSGAGGALEAYQAQLEA